MGLFSKDEPKQKEGLAWEDLSDTVDRTKVPGGWPIRPTTGTAIHCPRAIKSQRWDIRICSSDYPLMAHLRPSISLIFDPANVPNEVKADIGVCN